MLQPFDALRRSQQKKLPNKQPLCYLNYDSLLVTYSCSHEQSRAISKFAFVSQYSSACSVYIFWVSTSKVRIVSFTQLNKITIRRKNKEQKNTQKQAKRKGKFSRRKHLFFVKFRSSQHKGEASQISGCHKSFVAKEFRERVWSGERANQ